MKALDRVLDEYRKYHDTTFKNLVKTYGIVILNGDVNLVLERPKDVYFSRNVEGVEKKDSQEDQYKLALKALHLSSALDHLHSLGIAHGAISSPDSFVDFKIDGFKLGNLGHEEMVFAFNDSGSNEEGVQGGFTKEEHENPKSFDQDVSDFGRALLAMLSKDPETVHTQEILNEQYTTELSSKKDLHRSNIKYNSVGARLRLITYWCTVKNKTRFTAREVFRNIETVFNNLGCDVIYSKKVVWPPSSF